VSVSGCDVGECDRSGVVSGGATEDSVCANAGAVEGAAEDSLCAVSVMGTSTEEREFAGSGIDVFGTESADLVTTFVDVAVKLLTTTLGTG